MTICVLKKTVQNQKRNNILPYQLGEEHLADGNKSRYKHILEPSVGAPLVNDLVNFIINQPVH